MQARLRIELERVFSRAVSLTKRFPSPVRAYRRLQPRLQCFVQAHRPIVIAGIAVISLLAAFAVVSARTAVTVASDGRLVPVKIWGNSVESALEAAGITLGQGDETSPGPQARLRDGSTLEVVRAVDITVKADGKYSVVHTTPKAPRAILAAAGIQVAGDDRVLPEGNAPVQAGSVVRVVRVVSKVMTQKVTLPYKTKSRPDPNMNQSQVKVVTPGKAGMKEETVRLTYEDGRLSGRVVLAQRVVQPPQDRVIVVGTKPPVYSLVTSRGTYRYRRMMVMSSTAYYPGPESCGPNATGYTFTGVKAGYGIVAVDPRVIPLGSKLYIEGYGPALAADTGSAIKGNIVDLCFDTYREARLYGRKKVKVYILVP